MFHSREPKRYSLYYSAKYWRSKCHWMTVFCVTCLLFCPAQIESVCCDAVFLCTLLFQLQSVLLDYIPNPQVDLVLVMLVVPVIVNVSLNQPAITLYIMLCICQRRPLRGGWLIIMAGMETMCLSLILSYSFHSSHYYEPSSPIKVPPTSCGICKRAPNCVYFQQT